MNFVARVRHRLARALMGRAPNASAYAAATAGRLAHDWMATLLSSDAILRSSLFPLRARSRQLINDNAYCGGYVNTLLDNVLGERGIVVKPRVLGADGKPWKEVNETLAEHFERWSADGECSVDGHGAFIDCQELMLRTGASDGEILVRHIVGRPEDRYAYRIQLIDPDLLDHEWHKPPNADGSQIRLGVETDRYGKRLYYHMFRRHPYDGVAIDRTRVPVPARDIIHSFSALRAGQVRGVPPLTPTILTLKLNDEYIIAVLMAARIGASGGGGFFETDPDIYTAPVNAPDGTGVNKSIRMDLEPGVSRQLPPGITWKANNPAFPQDTLGDFERFMLQSAARSVGLSYATFTGDLSEANYASGRRGSLSERETFRRWQRQLGTSVIGRIYSMWVRFASMSRAMQLPAIPLDQLSRFTLELRGWRWDDPVKDVKASELEIANRLTSRTRVCSEIGRTFSEILDEIEEEEREMKRRGIIPTLQSGTQPAPNKRDDAKDDDANDEDDEETPAPPRRRRTRANLAIALGE